MSCGGRFSGRAVVVVAVCLGGAGCATRGWVEEQVAASERRSTARVDLLRAETAAAALEIAALQAAAAEDRTRSAPVEAAVGEALASAEATARRARGGFLRKVVLRDDSIRFDVGSSALDDDARAALDALAEELAIRDDDVWVEVHGHTDATGFKTANQALALARAAAVRDHLRRDPRVPLHRVEVLALSATAPIASDDTAAGRAANRRVTILVLE